MPSPDICACIVSPEDLSAAIDAREMVSLYEVRIDLIGAEWPRVAAGLPLPWIACNRLASQGGVCDADERTRLDTLRHAMELGAAIVDIEMVAPGAPELIRDVKGRSRVLVSHHDFERTDEEEALAEVVARERQLGADICKVVTTARSADDTVTVLRLARRFQNEGIVAFAMGATGHGQPCVGPVRGCIVHVCLTGSGA